jgi:hypothetical protein
MGRKQDKMNFFEKLKEKFQFILQNTKLLVLVLSGLGLIFILCIVLAAVQCNSAGKRKQISVGEETFAPSDDFIFTGDNTLTQDYYYSREVNEKWSQEDIDEWFTPVNPDSVESLSKSNDFLINDLMGAAP